jgi:hypothetical protein
MPEQTNPGQITPAQNTEERWKLLCHQAAAEHDPHKLLELTRQINELLLKLIKHSGESPH